MLNNKMLFVVLSLFSTSGMAQQSLAICPFLDHLILSARNDFATLRGDFDFSISVYHGKLSTPGYSKCFTEVNSSTREYSCQHVMPDDPVAAHAEWVRVSDEAKECLTGRSRPFRRGERDQRIKTDPHGAEVATRYQRVQLRNRVIHLVLIKVSVDAP